MLVTNIHNCVLTQPEMQSLAKSFADIHNHNYAIVTKKEIMSEAKDRIIKALGIHENSKEFKMQTVGRRGETGRYLIYSNLDESKPLFMILFPGWKSCSSQNTSRDTSMHTSRNTSQTTSPTTSPTTSKNTTHNKSKCSTNQNSRKKPIFPKIYGFHENETTEQAPFASVVPSLHIPIGPVIMESILNTAIGNTELISRMKLYLHNPYVVTKNTPGVHSNHTSETRNTKQFMSISCKMSDNTSHDMQVATEWIKKAKVILVNRSNDDISFDIAGDDVHIVRMLLGFNSFKLCIISTEANNRREQGTEALVADVTISHTFSPFDCLLEETKTGVFQKGVYCSGTFGLMAVAQHLLRSNIPRPIKSICVVDRKWNYNMCRDEIVKLLVRMNLESDQPRVVSDIEIVHKQPVVTLVRDGQENYKITHTMLPNEVGIPIGVSRGLSEKDSTDFRMYHSNAITYDIAFKNRSPSFKKLKQDFKLNDQEIANALYAGISFCHAACVAEHHIKSEDESYTYRSINPEHIPNDQTKEVDSIRSKAVQLIINSAQDAITWVPIIHNFYITHNMHHNNNLLNIECHISATGLLFFRETVHTHKEAELPFMGGMYIFPKLVSNASDYLRYNTILPLNHHHSNKQKGQEIESFEHMYHRIDEITRKFKIDPSTMLAYAAELLFYIKSICRHNDFSLYGKSVEKEEVKESKEIVDEDNPRLDTPPHDTSSHDTSPSDTPPPDTPPPDTPPHGLRGFNYIWGDQLKDPELIVEKKKKISNKQHHDLLCKAWLHTFTIRTANACNGVRNAAFYSTYAKLFNLSHLDLDQFGTLAYL